jgi:hypothetical protein
MVSALQSGATPNWLSCIQGVGGLVVDFYNFAIHGSGDVWGTINRVLDTIKSCGTVAAANTPWGWMVRGIRAIVNVANLARTASYCISFVDSLNPWDSYRAGYNLGGCVYGLYKQFSRRRRAIDDGSAFTPPAAWTCWAGHYNSSDGCDVGCGAFDPDCFGPRDNATVFMGEGAYDNYHDTHIEGWNCPDSFYNTTDGCDQGCGIPDPDCVVASTGAESQATRFTWNAAVAMTSPAEHAYSSQLASTTTNDNTIVLKQAHIAGIVVGSVFATLAIVAVVFAVVHRAQRRRQGSHTLLTNEEVDVSYVEHAQ